MACKYCGDSDESKLMMRSSLINGRVETIDICTGCFWFKKFNPEREHGNALSKKEPIERRISPKSQSTHSSVGKKTS
jgi:hypothetical protein